MSFQHLKERSYYEDLYDRHTVEDCRWHEEWEPAPDKPKANEEKLTPHQIQWCYTFVTDWQLFHLVGDRYLEREETINRWMERDKESDAMLAQARRPLIHCPSCGRTMECLDTHLRYGVRNERDRVEFFIGCKPCKQIKHVFEDGSEVPRNPILCAKCKREVKCETRRKDGKSYFVETCNHCGHVEETPDEEKPLPTEEEIERFERDKKRFCLTHEQGQKYKYYLECTQKVEATKKEHEQNIEFFDKLADVKKLNVAALEKLLKNAIENAGYADLHIAMPTPDRQIILNFSVRDTEEKREDHDSRKTLENTIGKILEDKNWALTSDGISYRLGLLSGRIRGYETEGDLQELTKSRLKKAAKRTKV